MPRSTHADGADEPGAREASVQVAPLVSNVAPALGETRESDFASTTATPTFFAAIGPALRTVSVHMAGTLRWTVDGHDRAIEMSACCGTAVMVTVMSVVAGEACWLPAPSTAPEHVAV